MSVPNHIAIIMDGNGRWAKKRGLPRVMGHNAGMKSLKEIVRACSDLGVKYLTVYAFSTENWKRPEDEVSGIFKIMVKYIAKELAELNRENVRIRVFGQWEAIPEEPERAWSSPSHRQRRTRVFSLISRSITEEEKKFWMR